MINFLLLLYNHEEKFSQEKKKTATYSKNLVPHILEQIAASRYRADGRKLWSSRNEGILTQIHQQLGHKKYFVDRSQGYVDTSKEKEYKAEEKFLENGTILGSLDQEKSENWNKILARRPLKNIWSRNLG